MKDYWIDLLKRLDRDGKSGKRRLADELGLDVASVMNRVRTGQLSAVAFPTVLAMCEELDPPVIPDPRAFLWKRDDNLGPFLALIERAQRSDHQPYKAKPDGL